MAPWPPGHPSWVMKGLGIRTALPRGRAERVRPRKPPIASSPGSRRKAISPRMVHPAEGRAPHARKGRPPPHRGISPLGPPVRLRIGAEPNALASVRPCQADAQSASLRENRPSRDPRAFLRKAISPRTAHPGEGRPPHARKEGPGLTEVGRHGPMATGAPILGNERPRHPYGLATRTRRARPSEKTAFRVISGPFSGRPSRLGQPPGGAGSARPQTTFPIP